MILLTKMKRTTQFVFFALVLGSISYLLNSCGKIDGLTQFTMEYNETVTVPSSTGLTLPLNLFTPDIDSDAESTFAVNDTRKDLVEEVLLEKLEMELISPTNGDFGFLKSITIYLKADGLDEIEVAWNKNVPSDVGSSLVLETSEDDLQEYIKKEQFSLRVNTVTDEALASDHVIEITSSFFVDAKVLGQ